MATETFLSPGGDVSATTTAHAEHFRDNRENWNDRAAVHEASGYGIEQLIADPLALSDVIRHDRDSLGDLTGLAVIHLQCHLGTDTLSLKRLGADRVVGVDLSPESLRRAQGIADRAAVEVELVEGNVYDARALVKGDFDLVYTSIGVLCWLPEVKPWARVIASLLRPGGRFYLREDHPFRATIDDDVSHGLTVGWRYFEGPEPTTWDDGVTYVEAAEDAPAITHTVMHEWNHGIGEVVTALVEAGLVLDRLAELNTMEWMPWPEIMERTADGKFQLRDARENLPLEYVVEAHLPA